ncbi:hypothetical protein [Dickeya chrysanthemi]|nr:hypothetical protein [Dickeya chrysanthemi]
MLEEKNKNVLEKSEYKEDVSKTKSELIKIFDNSAKRLPGCHRKRCLCAR